jgi:hypothetical protein
MLLVIRCPKCRGASRVDEPDLGQMVQCPQCADAFTAIEEAELVAPGPRARGADFDPPSRRSPEPPPEPPSFDDEDDTPPPEPTPDRDAVPTTQTDAEFDPLREPPGSLPASVLVGLALLPFLIPILWVIAPAVTGVEPVLSLGSALALAVSASVLCLAVIYTVDWRPRTRIRGVLLLVVLSYATGVTLYLLKKEWVDRVKRFFGVHPGWSVFHVPTGGYQVKLPGPAEKVDKKDLPTDLANLACHQAAQRGLGGAGGDGVFVVGSGEAKPANPGEQLGKDAWFDRVTADIVVRSGGRLVGQLKPITNQDEGRIHGREMVIEIKNANANTTRVVQVYFLSWKDGAGRTKNRVYYAAAEGSGMSPDDPFAGTFFESFVITDPPK